MKSKSTLLFLSILLLVLMIGVQTAQAQFRDLNEGDQDRDVYTIGMPGNDDDDDDDDSEDNLVLVISGTNEGEMRDIFGTMMNCFDVDLLDPVSGESVGSGTDCLDGASITPIGDDGGFEINNTQFFHLDDGTIVTSLRTTVQPAGPSSPDVTHFTGAMPAPGEPNQIISGTGDFEDAEGRVSLNGRRKPEPPRERQYNNLRLRLPD